jgi:hypothetical protein
MRTKTGYVWYVGIKLNSKEQHWLSTAFLWFMMKGIIIIIYILDFVVHHTASRTRIMYL